MGNVFVNLPVPAAPGIGAPVLVTGISPDKTVVLEGPGGIAPSLSGANGILVLEASEDAVHYAPFLTLDLLQDPRVPPFTVVAAWMRVRRASGFGGNVILGLGGESTTSNLYAAIVVPPNDTGPATNVSALGVRKTVVVSGQYDGVLVIEGAVDAGATYDPLLTCDSHNSGVYVFNGAWQFMRVRRVGSLVGSPSIAVGGHPIGGSGAAGVNSCILFFSGTHSIPGPNGIVPDPCIHYFANGYFEQRDDPWDFCLPAAGTLSDLRVCSLSNGCDGTTTVHILTGVTPTVQTVTIPPGTTGVFITAGAGVAYALNDTLSLRLLTTSDTGENQLIFTATAVYTIS